MQGIDCKFFALQNFCVYLSIIIFLNLWKVFSTDWRYSVSFLEELSNQANSKDGVQCTALQSDPPTSYPYKHRWPIHGKFDLERADKVTKSIQGRVSLSKNLPDQKIFLFYFWNSWKVCYLPTDNAASVLTKGKGTFTGITCSKGQSVRIYQKN